MRDGLKPAPTRGKLTFLKLWSALFAAGTTMRARTCIRKGGASRHSSAADTGGKHVQKAGHPVRTAEQARHDFVCRLWWVESGGHSVAIFGRRAAEVVGIKRQV